MTAERDPERLRAALAAAGVPVHTWRRPATRSVEDLARELVRGECRLDGPPFLRRLRIVRLHVERDGLLLHELALDEGDGRVLERDRPPAEKLFADEPPELGAVRGVTEELGVARGSVTLVEHVQAGVERIAHNPGYPGLATEYVLHVARLIVAGLPEHDFETVEHEPGPGGRRVVHRWGWR